MVETSTVVVLTTLTTAVTVLVLVLVTAGALELAMELELELELAEELALELDGIWKTLAYIEIKLDRSGRLKTRLSAWTRLGITGANGPSLMKLLNCG